MPEIVCWKRPREVFGRAGFARVQKLPGPNGAFLAAEVFGRAGFAGATVDDVAEAAGVTKGAVYSNFENKDDLVLAVLEDRVYQRLERIARLVDAGASARGHESGWCARRFRRRRRDDHAS